MSRQRMIQCVCSIEASANKMIKGYSQKIGTCDTLCAEIWGMYLGMKLSWRQGSTIFKRKVTQRL
ncbi:hypothetical protein MTR_5g073120 [Medicago truncatula]|uniref:Uncharacterized protein n=1 Tax=Medicago truncatula TaxID=3880 RepID=G7JZN4_MEDTR|nr:hypothetical protein MTR_5g073120 [Medicago truncatula]